MRHALGIRFNCKVPDVLAPAGVGVLSAGPEGRLNAAIPDMAVLRTGGVHRSMDSGATWISR